MDERSRPVPYARFGALVTFVALVILTTMGVLGAQSDEERLEELKAEREIIQDELVAQAQLVDIEQGSFDEVATALDAINALVDLEEARLSDADQVVRSAETQVELALIRQSEIETEVATLQSSLSDLAIASFTGEGEAVGDDLTTLLLSDDPSEAARRRSLIEFQTGSLQDGVDRLRSLVAEAEAVAARLASAVIDAEAGRQEVIERTRTLEQAQAAQLDIVLAAELRLEARLAEAAFIAERDAEAAAEIRRQEEAIARRIRQEAARKAAEEAARRAAAEAATRPPVADVGDIVTVRGIQVHQSVASDVEGLLSAARNDGVDLSGWGWRSNVRQIELRQAHCGTSQYAVWEMPASQCRPPTARPGQSNHERGLAIDFTYNGSSIRTRSNPGFVWLANNAARFGFVNLPSEPWHWSTNGN